MVRGYEGTSSIVNLQKLWNIIQNKWGIQRKKIYWKRTKICGGICRESEQINQGELGLEK